MFVYVIHSNDSTCKVGITNDVAKRLKTLQIGSASILQVHAALEVAGRKVAKTIEADAHRKLRSWHLAGEWFSIASMFAFEQVRLSAELLGINGVHTEFEIEFQPLPLPRAGRPFLLSCPHCSNEKQSTLSKSQVWRSVFRCSQCGNSVEGRRFFVRIAS